LICETKESFQIRKAPPAEAAIESPKATGHALGQVGERTILPGETEDFTRHFDIERLGLWIGNDRCHPATASMVAGDEV
jgi:hypothetical protein